MRHLRRVVGGLSCALAGACAQPDANVTNETADTTNTDLASANDTQSGDLGPERLTAPDAEPPVGADHDAGGAPTAPLPAANDAGPTTGCPQATNSDGQCVPFPALPVDCVGESFTDHNDILALLQSNLLSVVSADRPFIRYVSLANRTNLGICATALDSERAALLEVLQLASPIEGNIPAPLAFGPDNILYRIDLRDLRWEEPVRVDGVQYSDAWDALVASSPYVFSFRGDEADNVQGLSETDVSFLSVDALILAAVSAELYAAGASTLAWPLTTRLGGTVDLATAAADLLVSEAQLQQELASLRAPMQLLTSGPIARSAFASEYSVSMCRLIGVAGNRPNPSFCTALSAYD